MRVAVKLGARPKEAVSRKQGLYTASADGAIFSRGENVLHWERAADQGSKFCRGWLWKVNSAAVLNGYDQLLSVLQQTVTLPSMGHGPEGPVLPLGKYEAAGSGCRPC